MSAILDHGYFITILQTEHYRYRNINVSDILFDIDGPFRRNVTHSDVKGTVSRDFFAPVFPSIRLFWSYIREIFYRAVLAVLIFSLSYWTLKTTPWYLGNRGVCQKFLG